MDKSPSFSRWTRWAEVMNLDGGLRDIGVYVLANFNGQIPNGPADPTLKEIVYVGEASQRPLVTRLREFGESAFEGKDSHLGGVRYRAKFPGDNGTNLLVAIAASGLGNPKFDPTSTKPMERQLLVRYKQKHGRYPDCNDGEIGA